MLNHLNKKKQGLFREKAGKERQKEMADLKKLILERKNRGGMEMPKMMGHDSPAGPDAPFWDGEPAEKLEADPQESPDPDDFRLMFSEYSDTRTEVQIPAGFKPLVARIFDLFSKMGLELQLSSIGFARQEFRADGKPSGNVSYFNRMLSLTNRICAVCGKEIEPNKVNLCASCSSTLPEARPEDPEDEPFWAK